MQITIILFFISDETSDVTKFGPQADPNETSWSQTMRTVSNFGPPLHHINRMVSVGDLVTASSATGLKVDESLAVPNGKDTLTYLWLFEDDNFETKNCYWNINHACGCIPLQDRGIHFLC